MRILIATLAIACPSFCLGQDDEAFLEVEKSYQKSLYQAHRPAHDSYLRKLKRHRVKAKTKGLKALVKEIDREIKDLEAQLKKESEALKKDLKDVAPLKTKKATLSRRQQGPRPIVFPLKKAELHGGVRLDEASKALTGWTTRQAWAGTTLKKLTIGTTYNIELTYSTVEEGRIQVTVADSKLLPNLADTKGKAVTLRIGEHLAKGDSAKLKLELPIHRSKPFVRIHGLRLVPRRS